MRATGDVSSEISDNGVGMSEDHAQPLPRTVLHHQG